MEDIVDVLALALIHTQEYAQFPARPGWSWFDALNNYRATQGLTPLPQWSPMDEPKTAWSASNYSWDA